MKYGLPQGIRVINTGSGWQLTLKLKKLSDVMSEAETEKVPKDFGNRFRPFIAGVPCATRISGPHMRKYFPRNGIAPFRNRVEKQVISGGSITRSGREFPVWSEKHSPFQKKLRII